MESSNYHNTYFPLDPCTRQIRLATLLAGSGDETPSCELSVFSLDDKPCYKALSYTWGDPASTKTITVNGKVVEVRKSLHDAFKEIRQKDNPVVIWADALCIHQSNDSEKNHQVGMMREIYRGAEEVIAWLGCPPDREVFADETTDLLFDAMEAAVDNMIAQFPNLDIRLESFGPYDARYNMHSPVVMGLFKLSPEAAEAQAEQGPLAKKRGIFGDAIHKGILPRDIKEFVPSGVFLGREYQQAVSMLLRLRHFGVSGSLTESVLEFGEPVARLSEHIWRVQQIEDRILTSSITSMDHARRIDWRYENVLSLKQFFDGAYEKAQLPQDYHVVGAISILFVLASNAHIHQLPFFAAEDCNSPDILAWYPSLFWRHSLQSLIKMLQAAYWTRVWIVQEVVLASSARFVYGRHSVPWGVISMAYTNFSRHFEQCCSNFGKLSSHYNPWWGPLIHAFWPMRYLIWTQEKHGNGGHSLKLKDLLPPHLNLRTATDSRDHIFGILGLVDSGMGDEIVPDYNKSLEDVLILATMTIMKDEDGLDILFETEAILPRLENPSWVPNWAFDTSKAPVLNNLWQLPFNASKGQPALYRLSEEYKLEVKSLLIDIIEIPFDVMKGEKKEQWHIFQKWRKAAANYHLGPAEFWPTVFSGTVMDSKAKWQSLSTEWIPEIEAWASWVEQCIQSGMLPDGSHFIEELYTHITTSWNLLTGSRQLFMTATGRFGMGFCGEVHDLRAGDEIHIVCGCRRPLVLRPVLPLNRQVAHQPLDLETRDSQNGGVTYRLMGSGYVEGFMHGEAFRDSAVTASSTFLI